MLSLGLLVASAGCTGGNYVAYPLFPDSTCSTCTPAKR
jgi:hypothetical protein